MRAKSLIIGIVTVSVIGGVAWFWTTRNNTADGDKGPVLPAVKAAAEVVAEGTVEPVLKAGLSLPIAGVVSEVSVQEGDKVVKGQLLLRLDNQTLLAALHQAEAGLAKAQAGLTDTKAKARPQELTIKQAALDKAWSDYQTALVDLNRTQLLYNEDGASLQELDKSKNSCQAARSAWEQAQAELRLTREGAKSEAIATAASDVTVAKAAVEQAKSALAQSELRAAFDGTIASLEVKPGEYATAGTPIIQLADLTSWQIKSTDLTELNITNIKHGSPVEITFDGIPGLKLPGKVEQIRSFGEKKNGDMTYTVTVVPERPDPRLYWNMTAALNIKTSN